MNNRQIIEAFARQEEQYGSSGSLSYRLGQVSTQDSKGRRVLQIIPALYSYSTLLSYWCNGECTMNVTKYSQTTTRHQSALQAELTKLGHDYNTFEGV